MADRLQLAAADSIQSSKQNTLNATRNLTNYVHIATCTRFWLKLFGAKITRKYSLSASVTLSACLHHPGTALTSVVCSWD